MNLIKTLVEKYPNDADLGEAIRKLYNDNSNLNSNITFDNIIKTKEDADRFLLLLKSTNHENRVH